MPTIIPSYVYNDGAVLDSDGHSRNIYDTGSGRGLMSTANGGLDQGNLGTGFQVQSEHILPQLKIRTSDAFALEGIDCFQDAFATDVAGSPSRFSFSDAPAELWNPVPGCGLRFYLPHRSQCLLRLGFFCHPFRVCYLPITDEVYDTSTTPPSTIDGRESVFGLAVGWKIDGVIKDQTRRPLPNTARYRVNSVNAGEGHTESVPSDTDYSERRTATWYDMHLLETLDAGVHDVQLCLYMESVSLKRVQSSTAEGSSGTTGHVKLPRQRYSFSDKQSDGSTDSSQYGLIEKRNAHLLFQRATFGVRSARVLAFGV